jgi:integration host factor subunit alpha
MALKKINLIEALSDQMEVPKKECITFVESILDIITDELAGGRDVMISGFGKWSVRDKQSRKGRNPKTGEEMMISSRKVVTFKCSTQLKKAVQA